LQGYVDIALPRGEDGVVFATARLPKGGLPARGSEAWRSLARRPLVLFFSRRPTWDVRGRRPSHPRFALPCYLAAGLERAGFDGEGRFQVLVLESPGRVPSRTLSAALEQVSQVLPCDLQRCVLVGDGQGAGFAADLALADPARVAGLILFGNAGGLATPQLRKLRGVPIAAFKRHGDAPGADSIDLLRSCGETAGHTAGVAVDPVAAPLPWSLAVPLRAGWIGSFATRVTKR